MVEGRSNGCHDFHSTVAKAAAAAFGPSTRLAKDSAQRMVKGGPNGSGPEIAALARLHRKSVPERQRQHQDRQQQAAAAQRHRQRRPDQYR